MTLTELIKKVGEENIHVEYINQCITGVKERKKLGGTEISFLTEAVCTNDIVLGEADIGIVLWVPKNKWPKA